MDAFESLMSLLLRRQGYWTQTSFKVELTKAEKRAIGRPSSPRWELDLVAYKGAGNEVLVIECKSYMDSTGVQFVKGALRPPERYKLFSEAKLRKIVMRRLGKQLEETGACAPNPVIRLGLAAGKVSSSSDRKGLAAHFKANRWVLYDEPWIRRELATTAEAAYENDVALVVTKLLLRANIDNTV